MCMCVCTVFAHMLIEMSENMKVHLCEHMHACMHIKFIHFKLYNFLLMQQGSVYICIKFLFGSALNLDT